MLNSSYIILRIINFCIEMIAGNFVVIFWVLMFSHCISFRLTPIGRSMRPLLTMSAKQAKDYSIETLENEMNKYSSKFSDSYDIEVSNDSDSLNEEDSDDRTNSFLSSTSKERSSEEITVRKPKGFGEVPKKPKPQNLKRAPLRIFGDNDGNSKSNVQANYRLRKPPDVASQVPMKSRFNREMFDQEAHSHSKSPSKSVMQSDDSWLPNDYFPFQYKSVDETRKESEFFSTFSFEDLGLKNATLCSNIADLGIKNPTQIQALFLESLKDSRSRDLCAILQASTGSGKTLAYLLALLERINPQLQKVCKLKCIIVTSLL